MTLVQKLSLAAISALLVAGCSSAEPSMHANRVALGPATGPQASIRFVQHGGIYDWRAANDETLFVQSAERKWYRVDLVGPCIDLGFASRVRFLPSDAAGTFDRFSSIVAAGKRCKVQSVTEAQEPDLPQHPHPRYHSAPSA
jgi:hypothetical protein